MESGKRSVEVEIATKTFKGSKRMRSVIRVKFNRRKLVAWLWVMSILVFLCPISSAAQEWDFGGMFGSGEPLPGVSFTNPATNAASCPPGYQQYQVLGTANVDWSAYWCGRQHTAGVDPLYDFGGMYGYSSTNSEGAVPWKDYFAYVNPFTFTDTCPPGYSAHPVLGTPNVDNDLYFCYRPHQSGGTYMQFGGMTGDGAIPFPNPFTKNTDFNCPAGYMRYNAYGTPNVDYVMFYCGIAVGAPLVNAGAGSLGIGEPIVSNTIQNNFDLQAQINGILALHPRVVRMWMMSWQEFSGISGGVVQPNATNLALYQSAVNQLTQAGITIVGVDNSFPSWMTGSTAAEDASSIPCPSSGASYQQFLSQWAATWQAQASAFPDIRLWEVGNELNGPNTLVPIQSGMGSCTDNTGNIEKSFSYTDRVQISLDLMKWGRQGIKAANPNATVFMPAAAPVKATDSAPLDTTLQGIQTYISDLYAGMGNGCSSSTSKRNYFDGANWHPYIFQDATTTTWVAANQAIYQVLVNNCDSGIPVLFSEDGYTTPNDPSTQKDMLDTINLTQTNLPWVTYLIWFRAYAGSYDPSYAILVNYPFQQTLSAQTFCFFTGCNNLPYEQF